MTLAPCHLNSNPPEGRWFDNLIAAQEAEKVRKAAKRPRPCALAGRVCCDLPNSVLKQLLDARHPIIDVTVPRSDSTANRTDNWGPGSSTRNKWSLI